MEATQVSKQEKKMDNAGDRGRFRIIHKGNASIAGSRNTKVAGNELNKVKGKNRKSRASMLPSDYGSSDESDTEQVPTIKSKVNDSGLQKRKGNLSRVSASQVFAGLSKKSPKNASLMRGGAGSVLRRDNRDDKLRPKHDGDRDAFEPWQSPKETKRGSLYGSSAAEVFGFEDKPEKSLRVPGKMMIGKGVAKSGMFNPHLQKLVSEQRNTDSEMFYNHRGGSFRASQRKAVSSMAFSEAKLATEEKWRNLLHEHKKGDGLVPRGSYIPGSRTISGARSSQESIDAGGEAGAAVVRKYVRAVKPPK
eukprot:GFKZ01004648.1.p1 GENE.GFKZ01004648.1~~GFKZ01004648.1.p1  ORF type:complete len:306 (+),score=48.14 GFKZ01004648.1:251-1168(+)